MIDAYHLRMLQINLLQYLKVNPLCINGDEIEVFEWGVMN